MKILLIHPPDSPLSIAPGRFEPLSLEVLAATVPRHDVRILDLRLERPRILARELASFKPRVIGVTINNSIHVNQSISLLAYLKDQAPEAIRVVGGHHPTMMPADFRLPSVDVIFSGWAEKSFPEFVRAVENGSSWHGIPGTESLWGGTPVAHADALWDLHPSEIPFPRRDLVARYQRSYRSDMGFRTALINTTRGCPNRCTFCGVWQMTRGKFLVRTPADIFHEIACVPDNIRRIFFADDNTFINPGNALRLCEMIRESGIRKRYSGYCRSDTIVNNPDLFAEWKEIGLDNLCVGFEVTGNDRLGRVNKGNTVDNNEKAALILNKLGIPFRPHFLVEASFEKQDFEVLEDYIRTHRLTSPIFPILTPIPGTKYYDQVKETIQLGYEYFDFAHAVVPTLLPPREFYKAWIHLYRIAYPFRRNLRFAALKIFARITGNAEMRERYAHLRLINLVLIRIVAVFIYLKVVRHYKMLETRLLHWERSEPGVISPGQAELRDSSRAAGRS